MSIEFTLNMEQGNEKSAKCKLICQYSLEKAFPAGRHIRLVELIFKLYQIDKSIYNNHENLRHFGTTIAFLYKTQGTEYTHVIFLGFLTYKFRFRYGLPVYPEKERGDRRC